MHFQQLKSAAKPLRNTIPRQEEWYGCQDSGTSLVPHFTPASWTQGRTALSEIHEVFLDCLGASLSTLAWLPHEVTLAVNMVCPGQGQAEACTLGLALPLSLVRLQRFLCHALLCKMDGRIYLNRASEVIELLLCSTSGGMQDAEHQQSQRSEVAGDCGL